MQYGGAPKEKQKVEPNTFRTPLLPVAAVLCLLAFATGVAASVLLLVPGGVALLTRDLVQSGITDRSALLSWQIIHIGVTLVGTVCSGWMGFCLLQVCKGRPGKGMDGVYHGAYWLDWIVKCGAIAALALLILRTVWYVVQCLMINGGVYYLYSMLLSEALMALQAWALFVLLRRFLNCLCDSALSMGCTLSSGVLDDVTIPAFAATGFAFLAVICLGVGADRFLTLTEVSSYPSNYFRVLLAHEPVLVLSGGAMALCGAANIALWLYLRRYKRISEALLYRARRLRE